MKVETLFNANEKITIESYLSKCGVKDVDKYLKATTTDSPSNYNNIDKWCKALNECVMDNKKIYLLEDSDCDGLFSTVVQYMYCKMIDINCNIEIMVHSQNNPKSHGLNDEEVMNYLLSKEPSYLFINDASTNDVEEVKQLYDLGWKIVCSDHHQSNKNNIEPYCILVNNQISPNVENKGLSGTGIVWKCCKRYDEIFDYNYASNLISFVALSIISDSMDLTYNENYSFIKWGRERIHTNLIPFINGLNKDGQYDTNKAFSFGLITCFNSLIRLGTTQDKVELTLALCGEYNNVNDLIKKCKDYHNKQSNEVKKLMNNNVDIIYNDNVIIAKINEKTPLTGLVANKMLSKYNKSIILVHNRSNNECAGSVRANINLKELCDKSGLFNYNFGHNFAYGTSYDISNEQNIITYFKENLKEYEPKYQVLCSYNINTLQSDLFFFNDNFKGYFGSGIPIPQVHIQSFTLDSQDIQVLGASKTTIKFIKNGVEFIKFFCGQDIKDKLHIDSKKNVKIQVELIGELGINEFRGQKKYQIIINEVEVKDKNNLSIDDLF